MWLIASGHWCYAGRPTSPSVQVCTLARVGFAVYVIIGALDPALVLLELIFRHAGELKHGSRPINVHGFFALLAPPPPLAHILERALPVNARAFLTFILSVTVLIFGALWLTFTARTIICENTGAALAAIISACMSTTEGGNEGDRRVSLRREGEMQ